MTFIPTFLRYVSGTNQDIWTLKPQDAITALQAIWNGVYKGSTKDGQKKIKYLVERGCAVYDVVRRVMMPQVSSTISINNFQSIQRLTEWRSSIGSNGLAVVGDFMESMDLQTTDARKEEAEKLLKDRRYMYLKTKDAEDGETMVRKAMVPLLVYLTKTIQLKRSGRYRGPLVIQTIAQCWIDFDGAIDVPGFIDYDHFPYMALVLSATSVRIPLCMVLNIFTLYRCIVLSGCGLKD